MDPKVREILVLSGGGCKGLALIGVFKKFEELKGIFLLNFKIICCVSIGSLFGMLYLLGFSYRELKKYIFSKNLNKCVKIKVSNFLSNYGLDNGDKMMIWFEDLLKVKGIDKNITFNDLYKLTGVDYQIMVTNLSKHEYEMFNYINTPELKVLEAIRMAISVPFMFSIKTYKDNIYVDGALMNNYPIHLYKDQLDKVLGVKLQENTGDTLPINSLEDYIYNISMCFVNSRHILTEKYKQQTIYVNTNISTISFNIDIDKKIQLYNAGYNATNDYFSE